MGLQPSVTSVSGGTRNWNSTGESRDSKTTKIIEFHSNLGGVTTRSYNSTVEKRNGKTFLKKTFEFNSLRCRETILEYVRSTVGPRKDHKKKTTPAQKKKKRLQFSSPRGVGDEIGRHQVLHRFLKAFGVV